MESHSRRLGRLLGYGPTGINELLCKNTNFRDLSSFGVSAQTTHLYYADVPRALHFYGSVLGLPKLADNRYQIGKHGSIAIHPYDDEHHSGQPKSTAIALLTDQLPQWYALLKNQGVSIKYPYKTKEGGPHDGFVVVDPEGYLLEFEQFKQHPENEAFMAILAKAEKIVTNHTDLYFFGTITWTYHKDVLKMQRFYEDVLGFTMVADQGWTKIYQTTASTFIGLVDEKRGMQDYSDQKAVSIEWKLLEVEQFNKYALQYWQHFGYREKSFMGPENYQYLIGILE